MEKVKLKSFLTVIIVLLLLISLILAFSKINALNDSVNDLHQNINMLSDTLRNNINNIYSNVDESLKKKSSILVGCDVTYGSLDSVNYITPVLFNITPKTVSDDTEVFVTVGEDTVKLNRNNETFSGYIDIPIFINDDAIPLISVRNGGVVQNEYLENENMINLFTRYMPYLYSDMSVYEEKFSNGKIKVSGDLSVDAKPSDGKCINQFEQYFFAVYKSGEELYRKDITRSVQKSGGAIFNTKATFTATDIDDLEYYILATDSYGFTHKKQIYCVYLDRDDSVSENTQSISDSWGHIYGKDGTLLYGD